MASPEVRKIAIEDYQSGKATQQRPADILEFHRTAIVRWVREYRKNGKLEPQVRGHMSRTFSPEERERLVSMVKERSDLTLEEIREAFSKMGGSKPPALAFLILHQLHSNVTPFLMLAGTAMHFWFFISHM
jgi:transposase